MGFLKRKAKILLPIFYGLYLVLHMIVMRYQKSQTAQMEMRDKNAWAWNQIHQLEKIWHQAEVYDLVTPQVMASPIKLEQVRARLKEAQKKIEESEQSLRGKVKEDQEFFDQAYAYYRHASSALINIAEFLLMNQGKYTICNSDIDFETEREADQFRNLIEKLSDLQREKQKLDSFISQHKEKLFVR